LSYYHSGARASSESHESLTSEDRVRISTSAVLTVKSASLKFRSSSSVWSTRPPGDGGGPATVDGCRARRRVVDGVGGCRSGGGAVGRQGFLGGVGVQDEPERALPAPALRATEQVFHLVSLLSVR